jgi:mono/diheme cytochrome c family protein
VRIPALILAALVLLVAGCGGGEDNSANQSTEPDSTIEETTTEEEDDGGGGGGGGGPGEAVFAENGCGSCHTLAAAGAEGFIGPSLDESKPAKDLVIERVTNGKGEMPPFKDSLTPQQIEDVATYVSEVAGG